jgi:hypothetical protein
MRVAAASESPELWGAILAGTAPAQSGYVSGRIDLAQAPASILATLPGIDPATAARLVQVRDDLPDDERALLSWPWTQGVLDRVAEAELLSRLTVGAWTWRCTLACGVVPEADLDAALRDVLRYEVVFDVSDETPRIASLRRVLLVPEHIGVIPLPQRDEDEDDEDRVEPAVEGVVEPSAGDAHIDDEPLDPDDPDRDEQPQAKVEDPRLGRWR